jgi:protein TonB
MFDLTSGTIDRPLRDRHGAALLLSVAAHTAVIGAVAWTVFRVSSETLPKVPTVMAFVADIPAPTPPPPPQPRAAQAPKARAADRPAPSTQQPAYAVPMETPVGIQPEAPMDLDDEGGEVGGVEGGIAGGVVGGIPGGILTGTAPPPPPPVVPRMVRIGGDIQPPALVHRVEPQYPMLAVTAKVSGKVVLEAVVDEHGVVTDVRVVRSVPLLEDAAVRAVKQWRYQPLVLNGQASEFILEVILTFSLR